MDNKKNNGNNKLMVNAGMCLIIGGTMYTAFYLTNIIVPVAAIISCGVCLSICGLLGMISKNK